MPTDKNSSDKTTARAKAAAAQAEWLKFPTLAEVFEHSPSATIEHLNARHKEYQSLEGSGAPADRVRARLIATSYARTSELLKELEAAIKADLSGAHAVKSEKVKNKP